MIETYKAAYAKLNPAQKEAVDALDGPVLVVAGPGTGKTQLLSLRVANILQQTDTDASNILCLTFTNKAAVNMRERLYSLIGPASRNVVVRTFHSFSADIMNQYPDYFWQGARLSVAPDAVQDEIIQSILASLPLDNPLASTFAGNFTALPDVKEALKLAKEAGLTPEELRHTIIQNLKYLDKIEPKIVDILGAPLNIKTLANLQAKVDNLPEHKLGENKLLLPLNTILSESLALAIEQDLPTGKTTETGKWKRRWLQTINGQKGMFNERKRNEWWLSIAEAYEHYRKQLHTRGYYDYSDMLIEVLEQLEKQPDIRADIQERFLYVLIDEFQDTNAAQLRLAHLVADHFAANNRPNLMAVGDDDQSIFAFNGAELNNMLSFQRSYPDTKLIVLEKNYRSNQAILDTSQAIIELAEDRLVKREPAITKKLVAEATHAKTDIRHLSYPTRAHQQLAITKEIKQLWHEGVHDVAILSRKHESLQQVASLLLKEGVPIRYERQSNVLEHEAVQQVCLIAGLAVAIADGDQAGVNVGIAELLRHPMWQIAPKTLWKLAVANYSSPDWLESLLGHRDEQLNQIGQWLTWLARNSQTLPLPVLLEHILGLAESEHFKSPMREYYMTQSEISSQYLETLSALNLLVDLTREFSQTNTNLRDFVRYIDLNLSTERVIADESWFMNDQQAVQLLTIYKAKGLEFDQVFVVDAVESMWRPRKAGRSSPANLQLQSYGEKYDDYIRLLYVAATRAKRAFIASSYLTDERGNEILPTPLLSALPQTIIEEPREDPVEVLENNLRWPALESTDERTLLQDRLDNYSLSPTALIDFLNIAEAGPESFKQRHLLRIPTPRSAVGSYGTAIHAALETAQRLVNTSTLTLETVLDRFEATLQSEHLAPIDYARYYTRGEQLLQRIIPDNYLSIPKGGLSEQRVTDIMLDAARLNGKLDRIDILSEVLIVADYKTGKALLNFETKDQTKAVKAWRHLTQLLFYCLLVDKEARFKKPVASAQMIYVEADKASQLVLSHTPAKDELERLSQLIEAVWRHIMDLNFPDTSAYSQDRTGIAQFEQDLLDGKI